MEKMIKYFPFIALLYASYIGFTLYEEKEVRVETILSEIDGLQDQKSQLVKTKQEIEEFHKNIEIEKAKIAKVEQEIEKVQELFPSQISDNDNITLIRGFAGNVNIKQILSATPLPEENKGFYIAKPYKFRMNATYLQFLVMFEKIGEANRIMNIRELNFINNQTTQRGKFQIIEGEFIVETYKFNPNYIENT